ncbi:hypothetical protein Pyn_24142 [Prunus yedoensis var. nudiflora]|uniref:Uncharacterized protein n=1 Tax=Prunus yedoensis var. nudiflora TaxID=2094558 RepID=A0A314UU64_PRUYE|nr:hypothetical protein Pyn_24142 [Prunus yedoensis var. nudiflora]
MPIPICVKYALNHQLQQFFCPAGIFVCVNLVHLLVPSAQFVVQRLQIGFLHLPHNTVLCPQMKALS